MNLQTLIKNVQELAKEEGEASEVKLREAIEIFGGGAPLPLQAVGEAFGGRFFRSTDISFWIRVCSRVASTG